MHFLSGLHFLFSSGHLPLAFVFDPEPDPKGLSEQKSICGSPLWGERSSGELESENSGVFLKKQCKECVNKGQVYATGCKGNEGQARQGETTGARASSYGRGGSAEPRRWFEFSFSLFLIFLSPNESSFIILMWAESLPPSHFSAETPSNHGR